MAHQMNLISHANCVQSNGLDPMKRHSGTVKAVIKTNASFAFISDDEINDVLYSPVRCWSHLLDDPRFHKGASVTYRRVVSSSGKKDWEAVDIQISGSAITKENTCNSTKQSSNRGYHLSRPQILQTNEQSQSKKHQQEKLANQMQRLGEESSLHQNSNRGCHLSPPRSPDQVDQCQREKKEESANQMRRLGLPKLDKNLDRQAINRALASPENLPAKVRQALGEVTMKVDSDGYLVIQGGSFPNERLLRPLFHCSSRSGWTDWLSGKCGWVLAADKGRFVPYHRGLHQVFETFVQQLRAKYPRGTEMRELINSLYYKFASGQERQNTERLWIKAAEKSSLQDAVVKLRPFLEVLRYFVKQKWDEVPWMSELPRGDGRVRLNRIKNHVFHLMRTSENGPDTPVQWAAHPPLNAYPRSVVTEEVMTELVVDMANILGNLFVIPFPRALRTLEDVDAFFDSCARTESTDEVTHLAKDFGRMLRT